MAATMTTFSAFTLTIWKSFVTLSRAYQSLTCRRSELLPQNVRSPTLQRQRARLSAHLLLKQAPLQKRRGAAAIIIRRTPR